MGDRVLMQVYKTNGPDIEYGPAIYAHNSGSNSDVICIQLLGLMRDRPGDVQYASARLVQIIADRIPGNLSVGIWNTDHLLGEDDSHGDAGVVLIDADTFKCTCIGGYLETGTDGFPKDVT